MAVKKKGQTRTEEKPMRPILEFKYSEKVSKIPNVISPLVIIETMENFKLSRTLIKKGSSCDVMYVELFEKLR